MGRVRKKDVPGHELMTVAEVAYALRVDHTTVRRWVREGMLPAIILPGTEKREIRIRREVINTILGD